MLDNLTNKIKKKVKVEFTKVFSNDEFDKNLLTSVKSDKTIVTHIDEYISDVVKRLVQEFEILHSYEFFSEEDYSTFKFPVIILDPIDGTRELSNAMPECVVSLAIMSSPTEGEAWLYNPFTGFELSSSSSFVKPINYNTDLLIGAVSRTEYKKGAFDQYDKEKCLVYPKGSIAYKLGLLASGAFDFVLSKSPKNVWDIAGGTILLWDRGYKLYQKGREITSMAEVKYAGDLIWCRENDIDKIRNSFNLEKTT